jgi:peptide/nickel transport system ATP-binding protein
MTSFPPLTGPLVRMTGIRGAPPDLSDPPAGCRFHPRCSECRPTEARLFARQTLERPLLRAVGPGHSVACHLVEERS